MGYLTRTINLTHPAWRSRCALTHSELIEQQSADWEQSVLVTRENSNESIASLNHKTVTFRAMHSLFQKENLLQTFEINWIFFGGACGAPANKKVTPKPIKNHYRKEGLCFWQKSRRSPPWFGSEQKLVVQSHISTWHIFSSWHPRCYLRRH